MEMWRKVWRQGFLPQFAPRELRALLEALVRDERRLLQGAICFPPLLGDAPEERIQGTCVLGWSAWQLGGVETTGELERHFNALCDAADRPFSEPAACRFFLQWYDAVPRTEMRAELLAEIRRALRRRRERAA